MPAHPWPQVTQRGQSLTSAFQARQRARPSEYPQLRPWWRSGQEHRCHRPQPAQLSNHQRSTLRQIFQHPAGHNIEWRAVLSLLKAVGSAEEQHGGKVAVTIGAETEYADPPPHGHRHPGSCQPAPAADPGRLPSRHCGCRSRRPGGLTLSKPHAHCQAAGRTRPSGLCIADISLPGPGVLARHGSRRSGPKTAPTPTSHPAPATGTLTDLARASSTASKAAGCPGPHAGRLHVQLATLRGASDGASDGRPGQRRPRQLPIHPLIGIVWVIFDHLRPSGHIMPDHAGDRGAVPLDLGASRSPPYQPRQ